MDKTAYDVIQENKNHLPSELHYILDHLEPRTRNAIVHKNYIIDGDKEVLSYFQPPYYNRKHKKAYDLKFGNTVDLQDLWFKTFVITTTQIMFSLMKQYYLFHHINQAIK